MSAENQSIVIKKIKKGGHGHHGGAWKIALAYLMMALFAVFLVLYVLNSVSQDTRAGIAEYFSPSVGFFGGQGASRESNNSNDSDEEKKSEKEDNIMGKILSNQDDTDLNEVIDTKNFNHAMLALAKDMSIDNDMSNIADMISAVDSPEGLLITIANKIQDGKCTLFEKNSTKINYYGIKLIDAMAEMIKYLPNKIEIIGYAGLDEARKLQHYNTWDLSSDRANAVIRHLLHKELNAMQIKKVSGGGASHHDARGASPIDDRRVEIIIRKN